MQKQFDALDIVSSLPNDFVSPEVPPDENGNAQKGDVLTYLREQLDTEEAQDVSLPRAYLGLMKGR